MIGFVDVLVGRMKLFYFNFERPLMLILSVSAITIMLLATIVLVSFTETQLSITAGGQGHMKALPDRLLNMAHIDPVSLTKEQYLAFLNSGTGVVAVLVTLWFSIVTVVRSRLYKIALKESALVTKYPVYTDGEDDIKVMLDFYRQAEEVVVFAGDFDWIDKNSSLKHEVIRMANSNKITLVSYKNEEDVRRGFDDIDLFNKLRDLFHFDSDIRSKCSLIRKRNAISSFLYKAETDRKGRKYVCAVYGDGDSRPLLDSIASLSSKYLRYE